MRAHAVPDFPGPSVNNDGFGFNLDGVNTHSPQYQSAAGLPVSAVRHAPVMASGRDSLYGNRH